MKFILIIVGFVLAIKFLLPIACIPAALVLGLLVKMWEHKWAVLAVIVVLYIIAALLDMAGVMIPI